jgi:hypothetical protein
MIMEPIIHWSGSEPTGTHTRTRSCEALQPQTFAPSTLGATTDGTTRWVTVNMDEQPSGGKSGLHEPFAEPFKG